MGSENGWEPARLAPSDPLLVWRTVPGTNVSLQVRDDDAGKIMLAFAADFNAYVEPLRDPDSACYTPTNSVSTSNHLNATGMDLNWNGADGKTFRLGISEAAAYPGDRARNLRELLGFYEDLIFCGGNWDIRDWMHFQMNGGTYSNPKTQDFIARKIRPNGFSEFRRGAPAVPTPQPPVNSATDAVATLYDAVPVIDEARAAELAPLIVPALALAQCNTVNRIAMWLAQIGWESDGFNATEEYAKNGRYAPYIGRTWIMVTWQSNYADFGKWCVAEGLVDEPDYFTKNPTALADSKWAALGPAWYWTVARPQINGLCDAGDLVGVTKVINGGTNGLEDPRPGVPGRRSRYRQALALGDRLLTLIAPTSKGPLMALTDDEQQELLQKTREVWDQLRGPAGEGWPQLGDRTLVDAVANISGWLSGSSLTLGTAIVNAIKAEIDTQQQKP